MVEARPRGPCPPLILRELDSLRRVDPSPLFRPCRMRPDPTTQKPCVMQIRETELLRVRLAAGVAPSRPVEIA